MIYVIILLRKRVREPELRWLTQSDSLLRTASSRSSLSLCFHLLVPLFNIIIESFVLRSVSFWLVWSLTGPEQKENQKKRDESQAK